MEIIEVAKIAHEINKAYCQSIGDNSQPDWEDAPEWQKSSAINGVNFHLENPNASPSASHDSWLKQKTEEGWKHGSKKDPEKKEHPCFLPYEQLPTEQKSKDYLFRQIIHSLKPFIKK
ncbi:MAG TPA: RyR domain-containing protein [Flavobacterium sp.]|nr:RyR domain-containing protein [Flavobacterium sp.]